MERQNLCCLSFLIFVAALAGCTTPGYDARYAQCSAEAQKRYPVRYEERVVRRSRVVEVPTGQVICDKYSDQQGYSRTVCTEQMRSETEYYDAVVSEDVNSSNRFNFASTCTAQLCSAAFNNRHCTLEIKPANIAPISPEEAYRTLAAYFGQAWVENPTGTYNAPFGSTCGDAGKDPLPFHEITGVTVLRYGSTLFLQVRRMNWLLAWGPCGELAHRISGEFTQHDVDQVIAALKGLGAELSMLR